MKIILSSIRKVLKEKKYIKIFLISSIIFLVLFISIPIVFVPGNDISFQLELFTLKGYFTMILFSLLTGLMISMQWYNFVMKKSMKNTSEGVFGTVSGLFAGIFGSAGCPICIAGIFGFLGAGSVLFLIENQWYITGVSAILLLLSIYLTAINIEKGCKRCK